MEATELIALAKQNDKEAFCELVRLNQAQIRAYIAQFIRDRDAVYDIAQETFLAAYRRFDSFDASLELYPWLRGIARMLSLEYIRKAGRRKRREAVAMEDFIDRWNEQRLETDESGPMFLGELRHCITRLKESSLRLLDLRYFKQRSIRQISEAVGRKEGAIRMMLLRIRESLRKCVESTVASQGKP